MQGLLFTELLAFAGERWGDAAERLAPARPYDPLARYDTGEFLGLVGELEAATGFGADAVLRAFGRHLFGRFVTLYPVLFVGAASAGALLERLEGDVRRLVPGVEVPAVEVRRLGAGLEVGLAVGPPLADLAEGLLRGCLARFGGHLGLERRDEPGPAVRFTLRPAEGTRVNDVQPV